jgi:hypothetical protein
VVAVLDVGLLHPVGQAALGDRGLAGRDHDIVAEPLGIRLRSRMAVARTSSPRTPPPSRNDLLEAMPIEPPA